MEAKDTIIPDEELIETAESLYNFMGAMNIEGIKSVLWQQASCQAEISFKAGRKEVVEWIETNAPAGYDQWDNEKPLSLLYVDKELWEAKLKEWGLCQSRN